LSKRFTYFFHSHPFSEMFITKFEQMALLTLVRVVVDHTMPTPLQTLTKLKISSSVKNILSKRFTYFFHSHPFSEMFITKFEQITID